MTRLGPGAEIAGYRLDEILGRGGMGVVWQAVHLALDRPVALKVLATELADEPEYRRRFRDEARRAARIRHPHVVIVHDAREQDGVLVLAMDLVPGPNLAHLIREEGRFAGPRAVDLIDQLAGGLDSAHARSVVHRDVKPENVLVASPGRDEHAYLSDFGLAKALDEVSMTRQGTFMGTAEYMAPELAQEKPADELSDIYALGCLLFFALSGRPPYPRSNLAAALFAHVNAPIPSPRVTAPELPAAMDGVVERALAKAPEDRFPCARELATAARAAVEGLGGARRRQRVDVDADWDGHVVVAGLGESGSRLALGLDDAGYRLVVVERDAVNEHVAACRERDIQVVVGDATDPAVLGEARIAHARYLVVACGDDAFNIHVAAVAEQQLEAGRATVLTEFVHVSDLLLLRNLSIETLRGTGRRDVRREFFNGYATATRLMLERHPPFVDREGSVLASPRVCVLGRDLVVANLVPLIAAQWQRERPGAGRLPIVVAGPQASAQVQELLSTHPRIASLCDLDALPDAYAQSAITKIYIAVDESKALAATVGLRVQPDTRAIPIVVALDDDTGGVASALRDGASAFAKGAEPFGLLSSALSPTLLMRGVNELLARATHQTYLREQRARGVTDDGSMVPWDELPEALKNSNRRFADGIAPMLEELRYALLPAPLIEPGRSPARFSDDEIERLARREHERWMGDLIRDGWQWTPGEKDAEHQLHPLLVPWHELAEDERDKDRDAVRAVPQILSEAGFEIARTP